MKSIRWSKIRDNIEYFDEIYNRHCLNWFLKLANMQAIESENRLPRKLIGAWCYNCSHLCSGQLKILARHTLTC